MAVANEGLDRSEFSRSDDAQQLSACACVRTRSDAELCGSRLCIGQSPSAQQAMRASGVANHPAQIAAFPARSPMANMKANRRLMKIRTSLRMLKPGQSVKPTDSSRRIERKPRRWSNHGAKKDGPSPHMTGHDQSESSCGEWQTGPRGARRARIREVFGEFRRAPRIGEGLLQLQTFDRDVEMSGVHNTVALKLHPDAVAPGLGNSDPRFLSMTGNSGIIQVGGAAQEMARRMPSRLAAGLTRAASSRVVSHPRHRTANGIACSRASGISCPHSEQRP